MKDISRVGI